MAYRGIEDPMRRRKKEIPEDIQEDLDREFGNDPEAINNESTSNQASQDLSPLTLEDFEDPDKLEYVMERIKPGKGRLEEWTELFYALHHGGPKKAIAKRRQKPEGTGVFWGPAPVSHTEPTSPRRDLSDVPIEPLRMARTRKIAAPPAHVQLIAAEAERAAARQRVQEARDRIWSQEEINQANDRQQEDRRTFWRKHDIAKKLEDIGKIETDRPIVDIKILTKSLQPKKQLLNDYAKAHRLSMYAVTEKQDMPKKSGYELFIIPDKEKIVLMAEGRRCASFVIHRLKDENDWQNFIGLSNQQLMLLVSLGAATAVYHRHSLESQTSFLTAALEQPNDQAFKDVDIHELVDKEILPAPDNYYTRQELEDRFSLHGRKGFEESFEAFRRDSSKIPRTSSEPMADCFLERGYAHRARVHYHQDFADAIEATLPPAVVNIDRKGKITPEELHAKLLLDQEIKTLLEMGAKLSPMKIRKLIIDMQAKHNEIIGTPGFNIHRTPATFYTENVIYPLVKEEVIIFLRNQLRDIFYAENKDPVLATLDPLLRGPRTIAEISRIAKISHNTVTERLQKIAAERGVKIDKIGNMQPDVGGTMRLHFPPEIILELTKKLQK